MKLSLFNKEVENFVLGRYNSYTPIKVLVSAEKTNSGKGAQKDFKVNYLFCPEEPVDVGKPIPFEDTISLDITDHETATDIAEEKSKDLTKTLENFLGVEADIKVSDKIVEVKRPENALPARAYVLREIGKKAEKLYKDVEESKIYVEIKAEPKENIYEIVCSFRTDDKELGKYETRVSNTLENEKEIVMDIIKERINNHFNIALPESLRNHSLNTLKNKTEKDFNEFTFEDKGITGKTAYIEINSFSELGRTVSPFCK